MASSTSSLIEEVSSLCNKLSVKDRTAKDLNSLLRNPHMEALAQAYDNVVAQSKSYDQEEEEAFEMDLMGHSDSYTDLDSNEQEPSNALRVIGMRKSDDEPLGMTVAIEGGKVVIARILAGGLVDRQGLLHVGDTVVEVNDVAVRTPDDLMDTVRRSKGSLRFRVIPSFQTTPQTQPCYMRTLFPYDPSQDSLLPCRELGHSFGLNEILEVLNQEDPNWWQARKIVDGDWSPVGLVPSPELEERRRAFVLPEFDYATKTSICGTKVTKQKKKELYQLQHYNDYEKAELELYEEVCRMPPFERKTVVLLGAQGVGRRTLKSRLINYDPERFAGPIPHTSRPIREGEVDGAMYHFVKREIMEQDIADGKYLECGELQGHLYGTKLDSIRAIVRSGRMCVVDCNPQCLKILKTKEFMPYIVFVSAPPIDQLRFMHEWGKNQGFNTANRNMTFDRAFRNSRRGRTLQSLASFYEDEDLQGTIEESNRLYRTYETQFDQVIMNSNFEKSFEVLRESLDALSTEPQWVPINWIYSE
ncbi:MAGUK p55 subfamily member 2 [Halotydeus destructor]|nr:MAGUK p55 subfamily member 2 [Halotydeus destructor]